MVLKTTLSEDPDQKRSQQDNSNNDMFECDIQWKTRKIWCSSKTTLSEDPDQKLSQQDNSDNGQLPVSNFSVMSRWCL